MELQRQSLGGFTASFGATGVAARDLYGELVSPQLPTAGGATAYQPKFFFCKFFFAVV